MDFISHDVVVRSAAYQFFHIAVQIHSNSILFDLLIDTVLIFDELIEL